MTDKEYIRRYTEAAERAQRASAPKIKPGDPWGKRQLDEYLQRFKDAAKGYAERNVKNMPTGPDRGRAMKRSLKRVRNGRGVLHIQPEAPCGGTRPHCGSPLAKVT